MKPLKGTLIGAGCGLLVGIGMMAPLLGNPGSTIENIIGVCNYPAEPLEWGFFNLWKSLGLGPHGDAGFIVFMYASAFGIFTQWMVLGAIIGYIAARGYFKIAVGICAIIGLSILGVVLWYLGLRYLFMDPTVAAIMKMGGSVTVDQSSPNKPIAEVRFFGPKVNDEGLHYLKELNELRKLEFFSCSNVQGAGLQNITALKKLVEIRFQGREVTDAWLEHLENMMQLKRLSLSCADITDAGLEKLKGLTDLQTLDLEYCAGITDAGIEHLNGLTKLENLVLRGTKVGARGLAQVRGLAVLKSLNLDGCDRATKKLNAGYRHLRDASK